MHSRWKQSHKQPGRPSACNAMKSNAEQPQCSKPPSESVSVPGRLRLAVLTWSALLASCATTSPASLPVKPAAIPPLPMEARQLPAPAWCSPTCTEALTARRLNSLKRLTTPEVEGSPASNPTTP